MPNIPSRPWLDDPPFEPPPEIVDAAEAYRHALEVIAQETDSPHVREYCESILSSVAEMLVGGDAARAEAEQVLSESGFAFDESPMRE